MNEDVVEMTVKIVETSIAYDLTEDGWSKGTGSTSTVSEKIKRYYVVMKLNESDKKKLVFIVEHGQQMILCSMRKLSTRRIISFSPSLSSKIVLRN